MLISLENTLWVVSVLRGTCLPPERTWACSVRAPGGTPGLGPLEIKSMHSGILDHLGDGNWGCKPEEAARLWLFFPPSLFCAAILFLAVPRRSWIDEGRTYYNFHWALNSVPFTAGHHQPQSSSSPEAHAAQRLICISDSAFLGSGLVIPHYLTSHLMFQGHSYYINYIQYIIFSSRGVWITFHTVFPA